MPRIWNGHSRHWRSQRRLADLLAARQQEHRHARPRCRVKVVRRGASHPFATDRALRVDTSGSEERAARFARDDLIRNEGNPFGGYGPYAHVVGGWRDPVAIRSASLSLAD